MSFCSQVKLPDGSVAFVRHAQRRFPVCKFCPKRQNWSGHSRPATLLCDFIVGKTLGGADITCDAPVCAICSTRVGPDKDFCPKHSG
jgi:hypothetical protein